MLRKILLSLLIVLIGIQFVHPKPNKSPGVQPNHIGKTFDIPDDVKTILNKACNDCHSNNTKYPWYAEIQPVAWWLNNHIKDGKKDLNFSEFTKYRIRKQYVKLDEINKLVKEDEMPLDSYIWIHKYAKLTDTQKRIIVNWSIALQDSIEAHYPPDSLKRRKS